MFKELNTLNRSTVNFNPEFTRMIRPLYQQKFKQMALEYDPSSKTDFYCKDMFLTSLEGAPQNVGRDFYCHNNQLTSLKGAPQKIGGCFSCFNNQLTSLEGAPQSVGGYFLCSGNPKLSEAQIDHYKEFLKGEHQECLVDGHYMPPEALRGDQNV